MNHSAVIDAYEAGRRAGRLEGVKDGMREAETAILRWVAMHREHGGQLVRFVLPPDLPRDMGAAILCGPSCPRSPIATIDIPVDHLEFVAGLVAKAREARK